MMHYLGTNELIFTVNLGLSVALGGIIGFEREARHKDAGISTTILVVLGAMTYTYLSRIAGVGDSSRIAAQIVSGIGFIGAGLIIRDGSNIKNLTTAAGIWYAGAIGMSIGFGFYAIAILGACVSLLIPRIPYYRRKEGEEKAGE